LASKVTGFGLGAVVALAVCSVGGCQQDDLAVATLSGSPGEGSPAKTQRESAEAFADCLTAKGIDVVLWDVGGSDAQVALMSPQAVAWNPIDGVWTSFEQVDGSDMDSMSKDFLDGINASDPLTPKLMIGGVDRSADYAECFALSGYFAPEYASDPAAELRDEALVAEVSNEWASCARAHGHPEIEDSSAPVADGYATTPTIVLPLTITPDELSSLLRNCPLVGNATDDGEGVIVLPNIAPAEPGADASFEDGMKRAADLQNVLFGQ
jgi:hypothetical protein